MQLPIVASDAGGLPENVENTVSGFIVPRRDPGAAAEKFAATGCRSRFAPPHGAGWSQARS